MYLFVFTVLSSSLTMCITFQFINSRLCRNKSIRREENVIVVRNCVKKKKCFPLILGIKVHWEMLQVALSMSPNGLPSLLNSHSTNNQQMSLLNQPEAADKLW